MVLIYREWFSLNKKRRRKKVITAAGNDGLFSPLYPFVRLALHHMMLSLIHFSLADKRAVQKYIWYSFWRISIFFVLIHGSICSQRIYVLLAVKAFSFFFPPHAHSKMYCFLVGCRWLHALYKTPKEDFEMQKGRIEKSPQAHKRKIASTFKRQMLK